MKFLLAFLVFLGFHQLNNTSDILHDAEQEVVTIRVREKQVDCDGLNGRTQCYQVQKGEAVGSSEWETIPGEIENFRYEEGYQYDLSVEVMMNPKSTNEKDRLQYRLITILSKTKV